MSTPRIVVFASGRGSNFKAILEAIEKGTLQCKVEALITDQPTAKAITIAKENFVPFQIVERSKQMTSEEHEAKILSVLKRYPHEWVVLAGYMRILSSAFIGRYHDDTHGVSKVINIHPSLLPAFVGKNAYAQAFQYGCKVTGVSVHFVSADVDGGALIEQRAFDISKCESSEAIEECGLRMEHEVYPQTLQRIFHERFVVKKAGNRHVVHFVQEGTRA